MGKLFKGLLLALAPMLIEKGAEAAGKLVEKLSKPKTKPGV